MSDFRYTHRTKNFNPTPYETALSRTLFGILSRRIHDTPGIVDALNASEVGPEAGGEWNVEVFRSEMERLGHYPNSVGGPLGSHASDVRPEVSTEGPRPRALAVDPPLEFNQFGFTPLMTPREKLEHLLDFGLRNRWYLVGASAMVGTEPVGITRLGEKLALWRDGNGVVHAVADQCPHRGAALSKGYICASGIGCRYHGVEVTPEGVVANVSAYPPAKLTGHKLVKSYPVQEHFQGIFVYFGDAKHPEPPPLQLPEELLSPEWTGFLVANTWRCNYQYVLDNAIDAMHTPWLHSGSYTMGWHYRSDEVEVETRPDGVKLWRKDDPEQSIDYMEVVDNGSFLHERLGIHFPPGGGHSDYPFMRIMPFATPIDDRHCLFLVYRMRKVSAEHGAMFRFMFNTVYEDFTWRVIEEDRDILETMPAKRPVERLYQHDIGAQALRKYLRNAAQEQLRELGEGELTPAEAVMA